jgi:hypothetical protein
MVSNKVVIRDIKGADTPWAFGAGPGNVERTHGGANAQHNHELIIANHIGPLRPVIGIVKPTDDGTT